MGKGELRNGNRIVKILYFDKGDRFVPCPLHDKLEKRVLVFRADQPDGGQADMECGVPLVFSKALSP